jgi:hypothetical protein
VIGEPRWSCPDCPQGFDVCAECKEERMPPEPTATPCAVSSNNHAPGPAYGFMSSVSSVSSEGVPDNQQSASVSTTTASKSKGPLYHHPHPLIPFRITFV